MNPPRWDIRKKDIPFRIAGDGIDILQAGHDLIDRDARLK